MKLENKKVLVTGAGGFIGSHLVEALIKKGAHVTAFLHYNARGSIGNLEFLPQEFKKNYKIIFGDITDFHSVKSAMKGSEVVFHLAALIGIPYSYIAPASYVQTNVVGTLNVMQASLELGLEKVIHTSTSEAYGTAIYTPIDEKHPLQGQSPYSATKISADYLAESFFRSFHLPLVTIRCFNTYGPRQSMRAVIPTVIAQVLSGAKELKIGSLDPIRDFNYATDSANGFIKIAETENILGELINVGSGKAVNIGQMIELVFKLTGIQLPIIEELGRVRPEKSEVMELLCDNKKARELLAWSPEVSFETGLQNTIDFIAQNKSLFQPDRYTV